MEFLRRPDCKTIALVAARTLALGALTAGSVSADGGAGEQNPADILIQSEHPRIFGYPQCGNNTEDRNPDIPLIPFSHTLLVIERVDPDGVRSFTEEDLGEKPGECDNPESPSPEVPGSIPVGVQCYVLDNNRFRLSGDGCTDSGKIRKCPDISGGACWSGENINGLTAPKSVIRRYLAGNYHPPRTGRGY